MIAIPVLTKGNRLSVHLTPSIHPLNNAIGISYDETVPYPAKDLLRSRKPHLPFNDSML